MSEADQLNSAFEERLLKFTWAPAIAAGAGMLALGNIIANVPHPDEAMSALTLPLVGLGLALLTGLLSSAVMGVLLLIRRSSLARGAEGKRDVHNQLIASAILWLIAVSLIALSLGGALVAHAFGARLQAPDRDQAAPPCFAASKKDPMSDFHRP